MSFLGTHVCCTLSLSIFTTRCHASAVYAVVVCLAVSVSLVSSQYLSKQLDESSWFLAWRLPSTHTTVCCKKIWTSSELGYFPLELRPVLRP